MVGVTGFSPLICPTTEPYPDYRAMPYSNATMPEKVKRLEAYWHIVSEENL